MGPERRSPEAGSLHVGRPSPTYPIVIVLVIDLEIFAWCLSFDNEHDNDNERFS